MAEWLRATSVPMRLSLGLFLLGIAMLVAGLFTPWNDPLELTAVGLFIVSMMIALRSTGRRIRPAAPRDLDEPAAPQQDRREG